MKKEIVDIQSMEYVKKLKKQLFNNEISKYDPDEQGFMSNAFSEILEGQGLTDTRADEELNANELAQRQNRKLYSPDGRLAAMPKRIKSIKIKSIAEKAEDNKKEDD